MENLTDFQKKAFNLFKKNVSDISCEYDTDAVLLKWFKARNYNPKKAEIYFREYYSFYQTYEIHKILDYYVKPEMAEKYEFTNVLGYAKDGSVIRYVNWGNGDHLGWIMSLSAYKIGLHCCYHMWHDITMMRKEYKRTGKEVNEVTYIFDLEGFSLYDILHKCVLEMAMDLGILVQDYYPDIWGHILVINAPCYFDTAFNLFKPITKLSVIKCLEVASKESSADLLLKYIDADVIPEYLGGTRVDSNGDPRCSEFMRWGGKVPTEYYVSQLEPLLSLKEEGMKEVWVAPRGTFNHPLVVPKADSTVRVQFRTENGSIHLKVLLRNLQQPLDGPQDIPSKDEYLDERDEKTRVKIISPPMWIESHLTQVNELRKAILPGIHIFRFSNSHSFFGSRRLIYKIEVMDSSDS